jgi:CheY-like chemotaxis protein
MRVLLIDDSRDSSWIVSKLLERSGHEVRVAVNGEEALALAAAQKPNAVLLDIRLPKMDGYEVAQRLRTIANPDQMRIVALSGVALDSEHAASAGFDGHLLKPSGIKDILRAIGAG